MFIKIFKKSTFYIVFLFYCMWTSLLQTNADKIQYGFIGVKSLLNTFLKSLTYDTLLYRSKS